MTIPVSKLLELNNKLCLVNMAVNSDEVRLLKDIQGYVINAVHEKLCEMEREFERNPMLKELLDIMNVDVEDNNESLKALSELPNPMDADVWHGAVFPNVSDDLELLNRTNFLNFMDSGKIATEALNSNLITTFDLVTYTDEYQQWLCVEIARQVAMKSRRFLATLQ